MADLLQWKQVHELIEQRSGIEPERRDAGMVVDRHAIEEIHRQSALAGEGRERLRNDDPVEAEVADEVAMVHHRARFVAEIELFGELLAVLRAEKVKRDVQYPGCPWVFHREGEPINDLRPAWRKASKAAGLWDNGKPTRLFHDLRRTGVRNLVRAGVPEKIAMSISGHKTRAVFERYNIVNEADLRQAMQKLDKHISDKRAAETEVSHTTRTPDTKERIN